MQPTAAPLSQQRACAHVGFLRFDAIGDYIEWNGSMPPGLPLPFPASGPLKEQAFLKDFLANGLRLSDGDTPCSLKTAIELLSTRNASVMMELPNSRYVSVAGFGCGEGRGYVFTPVATPKINQPDLPAMQDERTLLRAALAPLQDGISLWDPDGRLIDSNPSFAQNTGLRAEQLTSGITFDMFAEAVFQHGHFLQEASGKAMLLQCFATGDTEMELETREGQPVTSMSRRLNTGETVLTFSARTGQDQIAQAQREADQLVRTIVEASPTTFLVSRVKDGKILYCPPASRARFGKLAHTLGFFLDPSDRQTYLDALLPTGQLDNYPVRFRRQDGSVMEGLTSARVIDFQGENVIVSSTRDITDYLKMQSELEKQRELTHQNEKLSALGALLAGVAHELNNPLSIVVGYALMVQGKIEDPILDRRVERIAQAAERCTRIVRAFLAMARQRPMEIEECTIRDLAETSLEVAGYGLKSSGAEVRLELDPSTPHVEADPDQIVQVLTNLVVNAEHAVSSLGDKGCVTLRSGVEAETGHVFIDVSDNGPGVAPAIRSRIFEPFFTTKAAGEGTGVGLAFCHRIVTSHGGGLTLLPQSENGACFRVTLKAFEGDPAEQPSPQTLSARTVPLRVLSIDDEEDVTELISDILEEAGCDVVTCNDSQVAPSLLERGDFDVVLSDMTMPGMDGIELLKHIAKARPDYLNRLGFVTGNAMSRKAIDFLNTNNCRYVEKPIAPQDLLCLVDEIFRAQHCKQKLMS